jgi:DNA-binding NarL/FixJ family response regulator
MPKIHRVIVCGNAVALAGIESSLSLDPDCEVTGHAMPVEPQELARLKPDVVIYALDAQQPELLYPLAKELPGLLLIGIDLETNRAVMWSAQQAEGMSSHDLVQVIHQAKSKIPISGREK